LPMPTKVIVVDDDEKLRNLVKEYLEGYGYPVVALPDGSSLMETIRSEEPGVVILDLMLPGRNGLDLLKEIRSKFNVPVIMLTAKGEDEDRIVGLEMGADDYIPKPFNPRELLARMKAVVRRSRSMDQSPGGERVGSGQAMVRQLRAILSADVKDYTRLMEQDELWTIRSLNACRDVIAARIREYSGRLVDSPGDNVMAEFGSVVHAVECAVGIQKDLQGKNCELPEERRMKYRIGVHLGDVLVQKGRLYGDGVNIAARMEGLAEPGGIAVSGTVYDQIENKLALDYEYLGEKTVKNVSRPLKVYRIGIPGC
jgi:class 3 adenylate cyclase